MPIRRSKNAGKRAQEQYLQVLQANVDRQIEGMSEAECCAARRQFRNDLSLRENMLRFAILMSGGTDARYSALYDRLLSGKAALPFPPPTSFAYPWYAVIDEPGAHHCVLGGPMSLGALVRGTGGATGEFSVLINRCAWAVQSANRAALDLLHLGEELKTTAKQDPDNPLRITYSWTSAFLKSVLSAYASKPEFIVKFGAWPNYRLYVGPSELANNFRHLVPNQSIACLKDCEAHLADVGTVWDLDTLRVNARIGKSFQQLPVGANATNRTNSSKAGQSDFTAFLRRLHMEQTMANLVNPTRALDQAAGHDTLVSELFMDVWLLEKCLA